MTLRVCSGRLISIESHCIDPIRVDTDLPFKESIAVVSDANCAHKEYSMPHSVVCLGDPVVDVLAHVSMESLQILNLEPGGCIAVDKSTVDTILANVDLTGPLSRYALFQTES